MDFYMKRKELNYFDEFIKNADIALEMSSMLKEYVNNFDADKSEETEIQVHHLENEADKNLHEILNYLIKDFLPPIEREDIIMLSNRIDDIIDCIDEVVINLDILNVTSLREDFKEFIDLIYQCCTELKQMLQKLKKIKEYEETEKIIVNINRLEEIGDKIYQKAIRELYQFEKNPIEVSAWTIIYNSLEECVDACESVASCVEEIILKNT